MAIVTAPTTGNDEVDAWANDISNAVNSAVGANGASGVAGSGTGRTTGVNPVNAVTLVLYKRHTAATLPSSEYILVDTKYTYATTELLNLSTDSTVSFSGWTRAIPDLSQGDYLFSIQVNIADVAPTETIPATDWSSPVLIQSANTSGIDGFNNATVSLFLRNDGSSTPSNPSGDLEYTFSTASYTRTVTNDGWVDLSGLSGDSTLWIATANAHSRNDTYTITSTNWTVTKLSEDGTNGIDGTNGRSTAVLQVYRRSSTNPGTPSGGSFTFGTQTLVAPTDWYASIPTGTDPVYISIGIASVVGQSGTDSSITWGDAELAFQNGTDGDPGAPGADAKSVFEGFVFQRSETQPSTPTGGSFNFTNNTLTPPSGWYLDIPTGSDPAWLSTALFSITGDTGTDSDATWSTPTKAFDHGIDGLPGADGVSVYQFNIYIRSATTPSTPTGGSYDFTNNSATAPTDWSVNVPSGTDPLYISSTTASISGPTGTDTTLTWSAPTEIVRNGVDGVDGTNGKSTAVLSIFKRSSTAITTAPTGGSYNFTSNSLTPPSGWSVSIPEGTDPVYAVSGIAVISGYEGTDNSIPWGDPVEFARNGTDGDPGSPGDPGADAKSMFEGFIFKRYSTAPTTAPTGGSFNFTNNTLTPPDGWSTTIPTGTDPVYVSTGLFETLGDTGTDSTVSWTVPQKFVEDGTNGVDGTNGNSVYQFSVYKRSSSTPSTPTGGSYNFTDNVATAPNGWYTYAPATDGNPLYASSTLASISGATGTDSSLTWSTPQEIVRDGEDAPPAIDGTDGNTTALLTIYQRASTVPTTTPTGGSFNFSTLTLTPPTDWYASVPAGTDPVYIANGMAVISGTTGTDSSISWGNITKLVENGTDGDPGDPGGDGKSFFEGYVFQRASSTPSAPTGGSFDFGNNTLTAPTNWYVDIPTGTDPVYRTSALFEITGDTGTDNNPTWTTPVKAFQDGTDGDPGTDGNSVYQFSVFKRSASAITTAPTGGSYDFTNNSATAPSGWSTEFPSGTDPVYASSTTASISGATGTDSSLTWSTPVVLVRDGEPGEPGDPGSPGDPGAPGSDGDPAPRSSQVRVWYESVTAPSAPSVTITWSNGSLSLPTGWSVTGPTVSATGSTVAYFSDVIFYDSTGEATSSTSTGSTPARAINFDGIVTFTNGSTISDGTTDLAFGALATADDVNLSSQVTGTLGTANASSDLINSNVTYTTLGAVPSSALENAATAINTNTTTIDGAKITTGTIDANRLNVANLAAVSANLGNVTAGTLKGGTLTDANDIPSGSEAGSFFDLSGGKFVVGNADAYIYWDGSNFHTKGIEEPKWSITSSGTGGFEYSSVSDTSASPTSRTRTMTATKETTTHNVTITCTPSGSLQGGITASITKSGTDSGEFSIDSVSVNQSAADFATIYVSVRHHDSALVRGVNFIAYATI